MKTILLNKEVHATSSSSSIRISSVQLLTLFILMLSLGLMYFKMPILGCTTLFTGIILQLVLKFYRENILPAFRIADLKSEMQDIINEMG